MNILLFIPLTLKKMLVQLLKFILIVAFTALVVDVLWGVASRYLLGAQSSWTEELARVLLIWVVLLGSAFAFGEKAHLGVDYLVEKFDSFSKMMVAITVNLIVLIFSVIVFLIGGMEAVLETFNSEQTMMAIGISKGYVYMVVPISGVFFVIFCLEAIVQLIKDAKANKPELNDTEDTKKIDKEKYCG